MQHHIGHDPAVDHVDQTVGRIDDPVVVGNHHYGCAVIDRGLLEQIDDVHCRILVESRGRLVGEDQPWPIDESAADRDPLALAARQEPRLVVDAVAEPQPLQDPGAALPHVAQFPISELRRHLDVFIGGERIKQIVHLKDETDVAPHFDEFAAAKSREIAAQHLDPAFVNRAQCPDQGQQSGLAGPRGAGHHDELTRGDLDRVAEQDLVARFALTVIVVQPVHPHRRLPLP